jgi:enoyl-[acyl-carrier protein] reductase II
MTTYSKTRHLMQRGCEFLGSEYAILCGAMSWVSERNLVAAISNAGGFGVIACGAMTPDLLDAEIAGTRALTSKPFGVNLITMHPMLFELIEVCAKHGVGHVVLAGGIPPKGSVEAIKAFGAKVIVFAPTLALARKLLRSGGDALVIEGMEAGGHIGPVATSVLAQEFLPALADEHLVFVAGGIGRGEAIAGYLEMGAVGVQLGTRFRLRDREHRPPRFQEGVLPRQRARRDHQRADRPAPAGDPGARAQEQGHRGVRRQAARGRAAARPGQRRHDRGATPHRALLGRRAAPRGDRRRRRERQRDGRAIGRDGHQGRTGPEIIAALMAESEAALNRR